MPDLDGRLAGLRDELRDAVAVPDIATVADRHRHRRFRRRTQIGAVVAVLVVSAVVPILRSQHQPDPTPPAAPPPSSSPARTDDYPFLHEVAFADADHGYALRAECDNDQNPPVCAEFLFGTRDGDSWSSISELPERTSVVRGGLGKLRVLGEDELAVDWFAENGPATRTVRMYSDDGGRTWREVPVPDVVTETVSAIPEDAELTLPCPGGGTVEPCDERSLIVVLPGSGTSARLATAPTLDNPVPGAVPTADGHRWVVGRRPGTETWAIAVSTDDGRTWTTTELDRYWSGTPDRWSVVSQDGTLYAGAARTSDAQVQGLQGIFRSDDDGQTWTPTWQPTDEHRLPDFAGSLIAADDGTVTANEFGPTGGAYTSTDGGHTLVKSDRVHSGEVAWTRAGYLALAGDEYEISADGVDWRRVEIPH